MEQGKKKILSDLYAIRATMSLVAENDDNADPERKAIADLEREQQNTQKNISNSEKTLGSVLYQKKKSAQARMEELRKVQAEKKRRYSDWQGIVNDSFSLSFWDTLWYHVNVGCILGVILVILIIASIPLSFALGDLWKLGFFIAGLDSYWSGVLITATICFTIICVYLFAVCIPVTIHDRKENKFKMEQCYAELQQAERELTIATEIYEAFDEQVGDVTYSWQSPALREVTVPKHNLAEINELIRAREEEVAALEKKKETLERQKNPHNKAIQAIAEKSQAIIDDATKAYPLIDFRDWENVDLLIYYFETGRADDMKEALQLVDRQRQTNQITDALEMASAEICKTIHHSMNQLGNALSQSFSMLSSQLSQLSSQLSQQHVEMLSAIEEQTAAQQAASEAQLKEIRAQTAAQVTSQEMNRALLAKISESSSDLAEQMRRQMREVHGILV